VSATVAVDVVNTATAVGIARVTVDDPIETVHEAMWQPEYLPIAR
jgi:malate dehydrogenase (oxaloacetate-decarboxylating)